ncbi:very-short-patch-repair endonuclease [Sphingomonas kyeonggiensis]|uniref:Very-short-patch-repair endonuclease n=1 Tax=Sphingomonas kyeonggiensis TaxID=1268553 RepID=A0A7W7JZV8_9SPHN|nr:DUF559 domain-containing protein [Sphingomonas kyeonggiensis]MBB4837790.1 very-short-patch-repair endonuclease [Sphingomonas kyeonggiensis]
MKRVPPSGSTARSRQLRANATDAERALWRLLREAFPDERFRRQVPIRQYTVDFASHRAKLVIEADGGQHTEEVDAHRTAAIEGDGYQVLRFWNNDILANPEGVARQIGAALNSPSPLMGEGRGPLA